jgi:hypothetical protein
MVYPFSIHIYVKFILYVVHFFLVSLENIVGSNFFPAPYFDCCLVGSEAHACKELSKKYTTPACVQRECGEACHNEGFTLGVCGIAYGRRHISLLCFCKKEC